MLQCSDTKFTKNFTLGSGASVVREGTKLCQLYLAQNSNNTLVMSDDNYMPGYDVLNRPIQQSINEAYIRNIATIAFMKEAPGCTLVHTQLDGQDSRSPFVFEWRGQCHPILTMTPHQIHAYLSHVDGLIPLLLANRPRFDDILFNIKATMMAENTWHLLAPSPFYSV